MPGLTIHPKPIKPTDYTLGGACFYGTADRLYTVQADAGKHNGTPIDVHVGYSGHRSMMEMSIEDAETLTACLTTAIRLRRDAESRAKAQEAKQTRAHFMDSDGLLEVS